MDLGRVVTANSGGGGKFSSFVVRRDSFTLLDTQKKKRINIKIKIKVSFSFTSTSISEKITVIIREKQTHNLF